MLKDGRSVQKHKSLFQKKHHIHGLKVKIKIIPKKTHGVRVLPLSYLSALSLERHKRAQKI